MRLAIVVCAGVIGAAAVGWKGLRPAPPPRAVVQAAPAPVTKRMEFLAPAPAVVRAQPVVE